MTTRLQVPKAIGVSVSASPDMAVLGFIDEHLEDILAELAVFLLATGTDLAYGGDLRSRRNGGFTELLLELVGRYQRRGQALTRVVNYLAWPVHIRMTVDDLDEVAAAVAPAARLVLVGPDGAPISTEVRRTLPSREPDDEEWRLGLTSMRTTLLDNTSARIVVGGQVENYKGKMPGIAEEALLSLQAGQPVFLVGGFGGCTRDIAEAVGVIEPWNGVRSWPGRRMFDAYTVDSLGNGLTADENRKLAHTPYIGQAVNLVMTGLYRLYRRDGRSLFHRPERAASHA